MRALPSLMSIVLPAYNESAGIVNTIVEIGRVVEVYCLSYEIIVVDDGSADGTFDIVCRHFADDQRIKAICFSRNFGKEAAILAGLEASLGDVVITMDADLQHPPSAIPRFIAAWRSGAMVVHGVKQSRDSDGWLAKARAEIFNQVHYRLTGVDLRSSSDFKLLDRVAVDAVAVDLRERQRFYRGLATWIGYSSAVVPFDVAGRASGAPTMSLRSLFSLSLLATISFTALPLRIVAILGLAVMVFSVVTGSEALLSWWRGDAVAGFLTLLFSQLFVGSIVMISLGIIGEYIAKIYEEVKARPIYLVGAQKRPAEQRSVESIVSSYPDRLSKSR